MLELLAMAVDTSHRIPVYADGFEISYDFYPAWGKFPYSAWIEIDKIKIASG